MCFMDPDYGFKKTTTMIVYIGPYVCPLTVWYQIHASQSPGLGGPLLHTCKVFFFQHAFFGGKDMKVPPNASSGQSFKGILKA